MVGRPVPTYYLFAAGERILPGDPRLTPPRYSRFRLFSVAPRSASPEGPASGTDGWGFPHEVDRAVALVIDLAERRGASVRVIDIRRPEGNAELVARNVVPQTLLPLLVAPSGRRLEGLDEFTPGRVKQLLAVG